MPSELCTQTAGAQAVEPSVLPQQPSTALSDSPASEVMTSERSGNTTIAEAQLHAVGSIADISANWSAKVVVASNEQVTSETGDANHLISRQGLRNNRQVYTAGRQVQNGSSV